MFKDSTIIGILSMCLCSFPTVSMASPVGGQENQRTTVWARSVDSYDVAFDRGPGRVRLAGNGKSDIDCIAFDQNGGVIDSDTDGTDTCLLEFNLVRPTMVRIEVRNLGEKANEYVIVAD